MQLPQGKVLPHDRSWSSPSPCFGCRASTRGRDAKERTRVSGKHDYALAVPGTACTDARIAAQRLARAPGCWNDLQLAVRKEADRAAIGRPERDSRPIGAGRPPEFGRIHGPNPEL